MLAGLLIASLQQQAQLLDVTVVNAGHNRVQLIGTATGPGFSTSPNDAWASMNLTWRLPKSVTVPAPAVTPPPGAAPEVLAEATGFAGAAPRNAFSGTLELTRFSTTDFGEPDDGFWYFQVTGTVETVQPIAAGAQVVLYDFTLPTNWLCPACVEVLITDVPALMLHGISTTSNIYNGGTGTDVLNLVVNNAPLPVAWLYVKAEPKENSRILVSWATASEQQNAGFEVERSEDGQSFRSIGVVAGAGNASTPNYYTYNDQQVTPGIKYYYRIKQLDLNGRARYSVVVSATVLTGNYFTVQVKPNPVKDILNIELQSSKKQTAQVVITDITGKVYKVEKAVRMETITTRYTSNVAGYPAGVYVAKVIAQDGTIRTAKFIISR